MALGWLVSGCLGAVLRLVQYVTSNLASPLKSLFPSSLSPAASETEPSSVIRVHTPLRITCTVTNAKVACAGRRTWEEDSMPGLEWKERSSGSFGFISIAIPDSGSSSGSVALAGACTANHRDGDELQ